MAMNDMLSKSIILLLQINALIRNVIKYVLCNMVRIRGVSYIEDGIKYSGYLRYVALYILRVIHIKFLFGTLYFRETYKWLCGKIDKEVEAIQIVMNVKYVNRYFIFDRSIMADKLDEGIQHNNRKIRMMDVTKHIYDNRGNIYDLDVKLPKKLIKSIIIDTKMNDIKNIFARYMTEETNNYNIKGVMLFNGIKYNLESEIVITVFDNEKATTCAQKKMIPKRYKMKDIEGKMIQDII